MCHEQWSFFNPSATLGVARAILRIEHVLKENGSRVEVATALGNLGKK
jgi:hypothetical protein